MKQIILSSIFLFSIFLLQAQSDTSFKQKSNSFFKKANDLIGSSKSGGSGTAGLSNADIVAGLKEALAIGAEKSANKLSLTDGFFKDGAIKLLMPEEAKKVESTLRKMGMGKLVDDAVLSMNRAAEDASKKAAPIFVNAVKQMTINDAVGILKGSDTAATAYLRRTTSAELTKTFAPVIDSSLKKVNATKYWKDVFSNYNKFALKPVNTDLNAYVTEKALNGLFYHIAQEEKNIRLNPSARVNDLLKKVFGNK